MKTSGVLDFEMNDMLDILLLPDRHVQLDREIERQTLAKRYRKIGRTNGHARQTDIQTVSQTDRHTHIQTDRQTDSLVSKKHLYFRK